MASNNRLLNVLLGHCYYDGFGTTRDYAKAINCYEIGLDALLNNKTGVWFKGYHDKYSKYYSKNDNILLTKDFHVDMLRFRLGECYYKGIGIPVNYKKSLKYFRFGSFDFNYYICLSVFDMYQSNNVRDNEFDKMCFDYFTNCFESHYYYHSSTDRNIKINDAAKGWGKNGIYINTIVYNRTTGHRETEKKFYANDEQDYVNKALALQPEPNICTDSCYSIAAYCLGDAYEVGRGTDIDSNKAKIYYALTLKYD